MKSNERVNPSEYYTALGRIVVAMNRLELDIRHTFPRMMGQETGAFLMAFSATQNFTRLMETFRFAFQFTVADKDLRNNFDPVYDKIIKLNEERGRYIHSNWFFAMDNSRVIRWRSKRWPIGGEQDSHPALETLKDLVSELATARNDLLKLLDEVFPTTSAPPTNA